MKDIISRLRIHIQDAISSTPISSFKPSAKQPLSEITLRSTSNLQLSSQFLTVLPLEIRQQIYAHVLRDPAPKFHIHAPRTNASSDFHAVEPMYGRIQHLPCMLEIPHTEFAPRDSTQCCTHAKCHGLVQMRVRTGEVWVPEGMERRGGRTGPHDLLMAMGSCKRMYLEAVDVLYGHATYSFSHVGHLSAWLDVIPATHVSRIRSVELVQHISPFLHREDDAGVRNLPRRWAERILHQQIRWEQHLAHLHRLTSLSSLHICVFADPVFTPLGNEKKLLGPAMELRVRKYVVELPGPKYTASESLGPEGPRLDEDAGAYPFEVVRRRPVGAIEVWPTNPPNPLATFPPSIQLDGMVVANASGARYMLDW
jgi:hypothetical protein